MHIFAVIGVIFVGVFLGIKFNLTKVSGEEDNLSSAFQQNIERSQVLGDTIVASASAKQSDLNEIEEKISDLNQEKNRKIEYLCNIEAMSYAAPQNAQEIIDVKKDTGSDFVAEQMIFAVKTHLTDANQFDQEVVNCKKTFDATKINEVVIGQRLDVTNSENIFAWINTKEWRDIRDSIERDAPLINKASEVAGIEPRLVVSSLMVEQLRLFFSQRELYKRYFEPLKILANSNKFSIGVMSIKEETARQIEEHLKDKDSPYYLGERFENLLEYPKGINVGSERYKRLSAADHSFNYLYGALYLKQFLVQWQKEGYDLTKRPEILTTLFNVGFPQSKPTASPKTGGSTVTVNDEKYSFGRLGYEFYYSGEMSKVFPYVNNL